MRVCRWLTLYVTIRAYIYMLFSPLYFSPISVWCSSFCYYCCWYIRNRIDSASLLTFILNIYIKYYSAFFACYASSLLFSYISFIFRLRRLCMSNYFTHINTFFIVIIYVFVVYFFYIYNIYIFGVWSFSLFVLLSPSSFSYVCCSFWVRF